MLRSMLRQLFFAIFVCFAVIKPGDSVAVEPVAPDRLLTRMDAVKIEVGQLLGRKFSNPTRAHKEDHGALVEFYASDSGRPVWVRENGLNERAREAIAEIRQAGAWGLRPEAYDLPLEMAQWEEGDLRLDDLANLEMRMSYAVLAYARHASGGRVHPSDLSENLDYKPPYANPLKVMQTLSQSNDVRRVLVALHPSHDQFLKLKALLAKTRSGDAVTEDVVLIPAGPSIRPGDVHPQVSLLRQRLNLSDLDTVDLEFYGEDVVEAVLEFQRGKGLRPDGIVGNRTRAALNGNQVVPHDLTGAILANMERWRWLPRALGTFHVHANIPEFMVRIRKENKVLFEERVVTGKVANKTPAFSDKMERVVFNPYWYPPRSIIINEIIPGAQRSSSFLRSQGLQVVNGRGRVVDPYYIDWYSAQPLKFQLRQPPGRGNALGVVKFLFPNKHAVYMHDTPSKSLFNQDVRTFSHGCVRVRNPRVMAQVIMREIEGWESGRINAVIGTGANTKVELKREVPVHVTYFTMWVGEDGKSRHFQDVYQHDIRTVAALEGRMMPKEVNRKVTTRRIRQQENFGGFFDPWFD